MPKDTFKNILREARHRNIIDSSYLRPSTTQFYQDYQKNKYASQNKMKSIFDKVPALSNQEGLDKAYSSPKYIYQNGNTLYIGGTQTAQDVWDDVKIPFDKVDQSQRYKDADQVIDKNIMEHHPIKNIVSHSLGGSVALKLVDKHPEHLTTTTTYGAPVMTQPNQLISNIISGNRYRHPWDTVSFLDNGAKNHSNTEPPSMEPS